MSDAQPDVTLGGAPSGSIRRSKSWLIVGLEALLIGGGVFLGLMAEQWRENANRREAADGALLRFRSEILTNRDAVAAVQQYHVDLRASIDAYLAADDEGRRTSRVQMRGIQPAFFESSAWDLALATQALADIDQDLAFALSRIYTAQQTYAGLSGSFGQAMYLLPTDDGPEPLFRATSMYYGDITLMEPRLLTMYDSIIPLLDRALADAGQ